ncbi:PPE family protein [Mycobacterium kubicae]|uniref:PPE family protein n=1 Tax=Mycobacterium kubicae TaxID=120959 RepID=UPI000A14BF12|nr:PPE family protein [Mycobacterium kubicae]
MSEIGLPTRAPPTTTIGEKVIDFGALPPEINSARIHSGPGSAPMLAAATAWDGLVDGLFSVAASFRSVIADVTGDPWQGTAATTMLDAAKPYTEWLTMTAALAQRAAAQARSAAAAYEAAIAMTLPPPVITANRNVFELLVGGNHLAQYTPAIAAIEANYGEMWAQNAAAMYRYASSSATATRLEPFTMPPVELANASTPTTMTKLSASTLKCLPAVPTTLQRLASPTASSPDWALGSFVSQNSWDQFGSDPSMSSVSALLPRITATGRNGLDAGSENGLAAGRPVSVRAWFTGSRTARTRRFGGPADWRVQAALDPGLGPAATVANVSVPQAWLAKAHKGPTQSAPSTPTYTTATQSATPIGKKA